MTLHLVPPEDMFAHFDAVESEPPEKEAVPPNTDPTVADQRCQCGTMVPSDRQSCPKCGAFQGAPDEQPKHRTPPERALTLGEYRTRLPTGIETLDDATRGGLCTGKRVMVIGPPGSLKTGWCADLALKYARDGYFVSVLAADEDADSILVRWGQSFGLDRDELEQGNEDARQALHEHLAALPNLDLWDADEDEAATIESVAEALAGRRADKPSALFADSIQTLAQRLVSRDDNRLKVDSIVSQLKRAARKHKHLVVATSEAGRGFYSSRQRKNRADPLAAGKESSGIEYGGDIQLVFSSVKDVPGESDVEVPKNRLGPKRDFVFRLKIDFRTARFTEGQVDADEDNGSGTAGTDAAAQEELRARILEIVRMNPAITSANGVYAIAKGRRVEVLGTVAELLARGQLAKVKGVFVVRDPDAPAEPWESPAQAMARAQSVVFDLVTKNPGLSATALGKLTALKQSDVSSALELLAAATRVAKTGKAWSVVPDGGAS